MVNPAVLETERLLLCEWADGDETLVTRLHGSERSSQYIGDGRPWSHAKAAERMTSWRAEFARSGSGMLKILERSDGRFIGRAGISFYVSADLFGLGFAVVEDEWGKGYGTEIARALVKWFFERNGRRLLSSAHFENAASIRVLEKIGMSAFAEPGMSSGDLDFFEMMGSG
jgi:RimJ/RimL family protein N-acetyltransferase